VKDSIERACESEINTSGDLAVTTVEVDRGTTGSSYLQARSEVAQTQLARLQVILKQWYFYTP